MLPQAPFFTVGPTKSPCAVLHRSVELCLYVLPVLPTQTTELPEEDQGTSNLCRTGSVLFLTVKSNIFFCLITGDKQISLPLFTKLEHNGAPQALCSHSMDVLSLQAMEILVVVHD